MIQYKLDNGDGVLQDIPDLSALNNVNRTVSRDTVGHLLVSTVFLGINHGTEDAPLYYETMIFDDSKGDWADLWSRRYPTRAEATTGHAEAVTVAQGMLTPKCQQDGSSPTG